MKQYASALAGIAIGVGVGASVGAASEDMSVGIALGTGLALVFAAAFWKNANRHVAVDVSVKPQDAEGTDKRDDQDGDDKGA